MPMEFTFDQGTITGALDEISANVRGALSAGLDRMAVAAMNVAPVGESGLLRGSIKAGQIGGEFTSGTLHGYVIATAPGAEAQEFGSGLHGERGAKYPILPKNKKALRFPITGFIGPTFREDHAAKKFNRSGYAWTKGVMHPGVRARAYLQAGVEAEADSMLSEIAGAVALGKR